MECRYFNVIGIVQGVFFRAHTEKMAQSLNLKGWVRNTNDGRVECIACGKADQLDTFEKWLHHGPDRAQVDQVNSKKIDYAQFSKFEIRY